MPRSRATRLVDIILHLPRSPDIKPGPDAFEINVRRPVPRKALVRLLHFDLIRKPHIAQGALRVYRAAIMPQAIRVLGQAFLHDFRRPLPHVRPHGRVHLRGRIRERGRIRAYEPTAIDVGADPDHAGPGAEDGGHEELAGAIVGGDVDFQFRLPVFIEEMVALDEEVPGGNHVDGCVAIGGSWAPVL